MQPTTSPDLPRDQCTLATFLQHEVWLIAQPKTRLEQATSTQMILVLALPGRKGKTIWATIATATRILVEMVAQQVVGRCHVHGKKEMYAVLQDDSSTSSSPSDDGEETSARNEPLRHPGGRGNGKQETTILWWC